MTTATAHPCRDVPPIVVNVGGTRWDVICGCLARLSGPSRERALAAHRRHMEEER